jgi:hypothetical protein
VSLHKGRFRCSSRRLFRRSFLSFVSLFVLSFVLAVRFVVRFVVRFGRSFRCSFCRSFAQFSVFVVFWTLVFLAFFFGRSCDMAACVRFRVVTFTFSEFNDRGSPRTYVRSDRRCLWSLCGPIT